MAPDDSHQADVDITAIDHKHNVLIFNNYASISKHPPSIARY